MGRPATGALGTFPALLRQTLRQWRNTHSGWGPKTLPAQLAADERFREEELPSLRSIARFLRGEGLSRAYQRHSKLPDTNRIPQAVFVSATSSTRGYCATKESNGQVILQALARGAAGARRSAHGELALDQFAADPSQVSGERAKAWWFDPCTGQALEAGECASGGAGLDAGAGRCLEGPARAGRAIRRGR